ncbi:histidine phosphatase family protein [uncultured Thalassospira sp.]|mgnify:CR=1 FL=1|uniref:histidine phosphatase family protein n=1 Tax=uncultured Thalassospira sp. TaxID=404382 RepID=UPI0030DB95B6|tara:strand:- start:5305 stop:5907 length:603 start_codon:yes stop_codon:yes gene_type:complete
MISPYWHYDMPAVPFVFMRHGETEANRTGIIAGSTDVPLNATGEEQARAIAPLMAQYKWRAVYASTQSRAQRTAELAVPTHQAEILPGLRERHWGDLEGRPITELCQRYETPPNGEPFNDMCKRVCEALKIALAGHGDAQGLTVIVGHSGVMRCILHLTGFDADGPRIMNATPFLFTPQDGRWTHEMLSEQANAARQDME